MLKNQWYSQTFFCFIGDEFRGSRLCGLKSGFQSVEFSSCIGVLVCGIRRIGSGYGAFGVFIFDHGVYCKWEISGYKIFITNVLLVNRSSC
jgi:hypothetical protein